MESSADILSQDEIDALLGGVEQGEVETASAPVFETDEFPVYDFTSQDRIVRGRMPTLEMINERFARHLRQSLFTLLRRTPEVSVAGLQTVKYGEYVHSLFIPACMNLVKAKPLRGTALFTFDPKFVFALVDNFFGGNGRFKPKIEGRDFTPTELRLVGRVLQQMFVDLTEAWSPVLALAFEHVGSEVNPNFANIVSPTEVIVVSVFHVELEGGGGDIHIAMPYSMIEPIRHLLDTGVQSDRDARDERWLGSLREEIESARVELHSVLCETEVSLQELLDMAPGDVLVVDPPEAALALVEDVPVFRGQWGSTRGAMALKVTEILRAGVPAAEEGRGE